MKQCGQMRSTDAVFKPGVNGARVYEVTVESCLRPEAAGTRPGQLIA
jgi:hypothetical protein